MGDNAGTQFWTATRNNAAPGSGTWSNLTKIVDIGGAGTIPATEMSGGPSTDELQSSQLGLIAEGIIAPDAGLFFVGNGGTPQIVTGFNTGAIISLYAFVGSWRIGNADYIAIIIGSPHRLTVISRPVGGPTWTELDGGNAPALSGSPKWTARRQGNTLYTASGQDIGVGSTITLKDFDFLSGTWGAAYGSLTLTITPVTGDYNLQNGDNIVQFVNGDRGLFYATTSDGSTYSLWYRLLSGGVYGAANLVATGGSTQYAFMLLDPSGETMLVFRYSFVGTQQPNGYQLIHQTVTHAGVVSGNLFTFPSTNPMGTFPSGSGVVANGNIYVGYSADNAACTIWAASLGTAAFVPETLPAFADQATRAFLLLLTGPALPTNPGPAGRKPIAPIPNQFDHCLHREYRLFCNIDYDAKGCARLPKCFTVDEREWGEQSYP